MFEFFVNLRSYHKNPNPTQYKLLLFSIIPAIDLATDTFATFDIWSVYCEGNTFTNNADPELNPNYRICKTNHVMWYILTQSCFFEFIKAIAKASMIFLNPSPLMYLAFKVSFEMLFLMGEDIPQVFQLFRIKKYQGKLRYVEVLSISVSILVICLEIILAYVDIVAYITGSKDIENELKAIKWDQSESDS